MSGILATLNVGKGALITQQTAFGVLGHNIANVNTPGFSRQNIVPETTDPSPVRPGQRGTGVRILEITRGYDKFLDSQLKRETSLLGRWDAEHDSLSQIEMIFDETGESGLNQVMAEFWNAWQELGNNPSGQAERVNLKAKTEILTTGFNKLESDLRQMQRDLNAQVRGAVNKINIMVDQIAGLNIKIVSAEIENINANDYRDKRSLLIEELSELIGVNTFEGPGKKATVLTAGGKPLVEETASWHLEAVADENDPNRFTVFGLTIAEILLI